MVTLKGNCHNVYTLKSLWQVKTPDGYTIGMAFVGMACNDKGSAININAYNKNKEKHSDVILGGRLYAHELGHNLGMW